MSGGGMDQSMLMSLIGFLVLLVQSLIAVIFLGIKGDIKDVKSMFDRFTTEAFARLGKIEKDLSSLWAEHRTRIENGTCATCGKHTHTRVADETRREGDG